MNKYKILYIEDDEDIRDLFTLQMRAHLNAEVVGLSSFEDAIKKLTEDKNFDLIISDYFLKDSTYHSVYKTYKKFDLKMPFVIITGKAYDPSDIDENFFKDNPGNAYIDKPVSLSKFKKQIKASLNTYRQLEMNDDGNIDESEELYTRVPSKMINKVSSLPCDIFIKLSEDKYLKIIETDEMFSSEQIEAHIDKGTDLFYCKSADFVKLSDTLATNLLKSFESKTELPDRDLFSIIQSTHHLIQGRLNNLGIEQSTLKLIHESIDSTINIINRIDDLSDFINNLVKNDDFPFEHALLTNYIALFLLHKSGWQSESTIFKLSMASMLHDVSLSEIEHTKILDLEDENFISIKRKEREKIQNHPIDGANIIRKMEDLPSDIDIIIEQHHERADGTGFPKGLSALRITPLSSIFIIAHEFAHAFLKQGYTEKVRDFIVHNFQERYNKGNFKVPIKAMTLAFFEDE